MEGFRRADTEDRQLLSAGPPAYLLGVSELGWPRKGNSSLTLPVSAAAWFLPCCSPHTQGLAPTICKSWGNSPLFPSKGIFLHSLGPAQAVLYT